MKSNSVRSWAMIVVIGVAWVIALSGCGKSQDEGKSTPVSVSATKDQMIIWNAFIEKAEAENWHPVVFYTRKQNPVRSLEEIVTKDQFAICSLDADYTDLVLKLFGYKTDDVVGLQVSGGKPDTLDKPKLRVYLAYEVWEEELNSYGWIPVQFVEQ